MLLTDADGRRKKDGGKSLSEQGDEREPDYREKGTSSADLAVLRLAECRCWLVSAAAGVSIDLRVLMMEQLDHISI
jgi:hypothetical protein